MNENKHVSIPTSTKLYEIYMNADDRYQMLHSSFVGMINTMVHDDTEGLFRKTNVGKRYDRQVDALGNFTRVQFYDKITNKPLKRFVLRTPSNKMERLLPIEVFEHTWETHWKERTRDENAAIILIRGEIIKFFETLGDYTVMVKRCSDISLENETKLDRFLRETYKYLNDTILGDMDNSNSPMKGFGYARRTVENGHSSTLKDYRFDFKLNGRIVFAKVIRWLSDCDMLVSVKPRSSIADIDILPIMSDGSEPRGLNTTQRKVIDGFNEICMRYMRVDK